MHPPAYIPPHLGTLLFLCASCSFSGSSSSSDNSEINLDASTDSSPVQSSDASADGSIDAAIDAGAPDAPRPVQALVFTEGEEYNGTRDAVILSSSPSDSFGALSSVRWEDETRNGTRELSIGLVQFRELVGDGPGQIPRDAEILSAELVLFVTNPGSSGSFFRSNMPWSETTTFNQLAGDDGVISPEQEYDLGLVWPAPQTEGTHFFEVTETVQSWIDGSSDNNGWVFIPHGDNAVEIASSESNPSSRRPALRVEFR